MDAPKPVLPTESSASSAERVVLELEQNAAEPTVPKPASKESFSEK